MDIVVSFVLGCSQQNSTEGRKKMTLLDIHKSVKDLSRWEKFQLVQQLIADLAQEETTPPLDSQKEQGYWSQQKVGW